MSLNQLGETQSSVWNMDYFTITGEFLSTLGSGGELWVKLLRWHSWIGQSWFRGPRRKTLSLVSKHLACFWLIQTISCCSFSPLCCCPGGHFIVFETSTIQKIKGVEFTNMGQQGKLGRYPVHFHLSRNVFGSSVTKISVHHTNQRCVVVHGSFNLRIERNVAYMTKGHCFVLEDGIESGNVFYRNLGFSTVQKYHYIQHSWWAFKGIFFLKERTLRVRRAFGGT